MKLGKSTIFEVMRFAVVGLINTILDISVFYFLKRVLDLPIAFSSVFTVIFVMSASYLMNTYYVFKKRPTTRSYVDFIISTALGVAVIQTVLSVVFAETFDLYADRLSFIQSENIRLFISDSALRMIGIIFSLVWNYLFYKFYVFRKAPVDK